MGNEVQTLGELMERYASGDERVFDSLYGLLAPRLYGFCRRLALHEAEADDLFQETFLRLHRARGTFVSGANALHWAFAIARSVFLTRQRYRRRRPEHVGTTADIAEREESQPAHESTPEAEAMASNLLDVAVAELQHMSEKNRAAYVLLKEEGLSAREAAAILGITPDAVKQRAHRAYEQLRGALDGEGYECELT